MQNLQIIPLTDGRPRPFPLRRIYSNADWLVHFRLYLFGTTWLENRGTE